MTQEIWKDIPGYEGLYQVSDHGRVRNGKGRVLRPNRMTHGYYCVHLYNGGKRGRRVFTVHRLVAQAFVVNPENMAEVNHKNFDRADNRVNNLEWVSRSGNVSHAIAGGRRSKVSKMVMGVHIGTGRVVKFAGQIEAERAIRGRQTGGISHAMRHNRPAYGYVWCWI